jgi:integrase/recombinase XerD
MLACLALGCRRTEFVSLKREDINWDRRTVRLTVTKGRKPRTVDIGPWAAEALRELEALSTGERLLDVKPATLNEWVKTAARDCGFPPGRMQHAHTLRASFASFMADEDIPLHVIAELMGHSNPKTTLAYISIGKRRTTREAVAVLGRREDPPHAEGTDVRGVR